MDDPRANPARLRTYRVRLFWPTLNRHTLLRLDAIDAWDANAFVRLNYDGAMPYGFEAWDEQRHGRELRAYFDAQEPRTAPPPPAPEGQPTVLLVKPDQADAARKLAGWSEPQAAPEERKDGLCVWCGFALHPPDCPVVTQRAPAVTCPGCDGIGREPDECDGRMVERTCTDCGGTGKVPATSDNPGVPTQGANPEGPQG